jgi:hypothetical protein
MLPPQSIDLETVQRPKDLTPLDGKSGHVGFLGDELPNGCQLFIEFDTVHHGVPQFLQIGGFLIAFGYEFNDIFIDTDLHKSPFACCIYFNRPNAFLHQMWFNSGSIMAQ